VSWYDGRNVLGLGGPGATDGIRKDDAQIWAAFSTGVGASFAPNFQVSVGTFNAPDAQSFGTSYVDLAVRLLTARAPTDTRTSGITSGCPSPVPGTARA